MTDASILQTEAELMRLSHAFAYLRDYNEVDELIELFTPDALYGVFKVCSGIDEIREALMQPRGDLLIRHVSTSFHFEHISADEVRGVVYNISHHGIYTNPGEVPVALAGKVLFEFHDRYVRTGQGWRFAQRICRPALADADSPMMQAPKWRPENVS